MHGYNFHGHSGMAIVKITAEAQVLADIAEWCNMREYDHQSLQARAWQTTIAEAEKRSAIVNRLEFALRSKLVQTR